jgi:hypothetical protein
MALALLVTALFASSASAMKVTVAHTDLAMGDSLSFGYSQQLFNENEKLGLPPTAFEHGYANDYFTLSKGKPLGGQLVNVGCPGETTSSLIGNGPLGKGMEGALGTTTEAPCTTYPISQLHHPYPGTDSQLETALTVIAEEAGAKTPVTTLTLNIGANDELHQIAKCEKEAEPAEKAAGEKAYVETLEKGGTTAEAEAAYKVAAEAAGKASVKKCIEEHATALFTGILKNIGGIMYVLRNATAFGYPVSYTGKIVVQGGYDPYGNVFGTGELLSGSNALASILNFKEAKLVTDTGTEAEEEGHPPFGACYANPQPEFNTGKKSEPLRLQKWTNMANFTEFEGKKNGPDIHPTPLGYKQLAKIMKTDCGAVE